MCGKTFTHDDIKNTPILFPELVFMHLQYHSAHLLQDMFTALEHTHRTPEIEDLFHQRDLFLQTYTDAQKLTKENPPIRAS